MTDFPNLLRIHLANAAITVSQLARESGLPRRTIANWMEGYAQRPRYWTDVLKIAGALPLDRLATDNLLASAGFSSTAALIMRNPDNVLLQTWTNAGLADSVAHQVLSIIGESGAAIFQQLPFAKSVALMEQTVQLADMLGDIRYSCQLMLNFARCLVWLARDEAAIEMLHKALNLADRTQRTELLFDVRTQLVSTLAMTRTDYAELEQQRRHLQAELQNPSILPMMLRLEALHSLGLWAGAVLRYDESATYYEQVCGLASESPTHRRAQLIALNNLGDLALRRGDYEDAQHVLKGALALSNPQLRDATTYLHLNLGIAKMRNGDHEGADMEYAKTLQLVSAIDDVRGAFSLTLGRAELAIRRGDQANAEILFRAALNTSEEHSFNDAKIVLTYCINRIRRGQGQYLATDPVYRDWIEVSGW